MNTLLDDLVTLNQIILKNAKSQFSDDIESKLTTFAAFKSMPTEKLTAQVSTNVVSGEKRYEIATSTTGSSWTMALTFGLDKSITEIPYVVLSFSQLGQSQEMVFNQVEKTKNENQFQAHLVLDKLEQRDALLRALSDYDAQTTLVVAIKTTSSLLNTVTDPQIFYFAPDYYPYIYKGIAPPSARLELVQMPMEYESLWYNYYQDNIKKSYLYYLPNAFELATNQNDDNKPMLSMYFTVPDNASSLDGVNVTFEYFLLPKVDRKRITSATTEFKKQQEQGQLVPFSNAEKFELMLSLPAGKTEEKNAVINLQSGIVDSFTIPSSQFGQVWDAFFSQSSQDLLLKGNLKVYLKGFNPNSIPVQLSLPTQYQKDPNQFIKQSTPATIKKNIEFKSDPSSYNEDGPKPIKRILVNANSSTVELNKDQLSQNIEMNISVLQLLLNQEKSISYDYNLQIFYVDGTNKTLTDQSSTFEIIYVP